MPLVMPTPKEFADLPPRKRRRVARSLGLLASEYRQTDPRSFKASDTPDLYQLLYRERFGVIPGGDS